MRSEILFTGLLLLPFLTTGHVGEHTLKNSSSVPETAKAFLPFKEHLEISWDEKFVYVEGNGLPQHNMMVGITAWQQQVPLPKNYTGMEGAFRIPLDPVLLDEPEELTLQGPVALAVNGIPIFHSLTQSGRDAFNVGELDQWGGHCGRADDYHYHIAPGHLEEIVGKGNPVAYGLDGFPVYMADPSKDKPLDQAHGYFDENGNYRYVSGTEVPYTLGMFRGVVDLDARPRAGGLRPHLRPLRGASITDFEGTLQSGYNLHYEVDGKLAHVHYRMNADGSADFTFTDQYGIVKKETYSPRPQKDKKRKGKQRP